MLFRSARRGAGEGGLSVNGQKIGVDDLSDELSDLTLLPGGRLLLRRGRKNAAMIQRHD